MQELKVMLGVGSPSGVKGSTMRVRQLCMVLSVADTCGHVVRDAVQ